MALPRLPAAAAAIALLLAGAFYVAYRQWEDLALLIANRALAPSDLEVEAVAVETLDLRRLRLERVVLRTDRTRARLEGVEVPIDLPAIRGHRPRIWSVDGVFLDRGEAQAEAQGPRTEPAPPGTTGSAIWLERLLALPRALPDTRVRIGRLRGTGLPEVTALDWRSAPGSQRARARVLGLDLSLHLRTTPEDSAEAQFSVRGERAQEILRGTLAFEAPAGPVLVAAGPVRVALAPALAAARRLASVPGSITALRGAVEGTVTVRADTGAGRRTSAGFGLVTGQVIEAEVGTGDGVLRARLLPGAPFEGRIDLPAGPWRVTSASSTLQLAQGPFEDFSVTLTELACGSGAICTFGAQMEAPSIPLGRGNGVRLGLSAAAPAVEFSTAGEEWRVAVPRGAVAVDGLRVGTAVRATLPVTVRDVRIEGSGQAASADLELGAGTVHLAAPELELRTPGARGTLRHRRGEWTAEAELGSGPEGVTGRVSGRYDPAQAVATVRARDLTIDFGARPLSARVRAWPFPWDVLDGAWRADVQARWTPGEGFSHSAAHTLRALAGRYGEIAFAGLEADFDTRSAGAVLPEPFEADVRLALLDAGVPLTDFGAAVAVDPSRGPVQVRDLGFTAFGGRVAAEPFRFDPATARTDVTLRPRGIDLGALVGAVGVPSLVVEGRVSGRLPVTIGPGGPVLEGGHLVADAPGGRVRYAATGCTPEVMARRTGIEFARCLLEDYAFDSLEADVTYDRTGALRLALRLTGRNPTFDPEQPVNLNPELETDLRSLLESLRATRSITEAIERALAP